MSDLLDVLREYAKDWRDRAGDVAPVHKAISEIEQLRSQLAAARSALEKANNFIVDRHGAGCSTNTELEVLLSEIGTLLASANDCDVCSGDCSAANPPVMNCPRAQEPAGQSEALRASIAAINVDDEGHPEGNLQYVLIRGFSALGWSQPTNASNDAIDAILALVPAGSTSPGGNDDVDRLRDLAKRLSNALLKVRPLGGSELFIRFGDDYYADPDYCGKLIEELQNSHTESRKALARASKAAHPTVKVSGDAAEMRERAAMRGALIGLNKALDCYWNGNKSDGQVKSICAWQTQCKDALAGLLIEPATDVRDDPGCCPACGSDSYIAGAPWWQHDDEKRWSAAASITCDRCDHEWDGDLAIRALPLTPEGPVVSEQLTISGEQRLRNIRTRVRIIARRQMRDFLAGKLDMLPCSGDLERKLIAAEFDRLSASAALAVSERDRAGK